MATAEMTIALTRSMPSQAAKAPGALRQSALRRMMTAAIEAFQDAQDMRRAYIKRYPFRDC